MSVHFLGRQHKLVAAEIVAAYRPLARPRFHQSANVGDGQRRLREFAFEVFDKRAHFGVVFLFLAQMPRPFRVLLFRAACRHNLAEEYALGFGKVGAQGFWVLFVHPALVRQPPVRALHPYQFLKRHESGAGVLVAGVHKLAGMSENVKRAVRLHAWPRLCKHGVDEFRLVAFVPIGRRVRELVALDVYAVGRISQEKGDGRGRDLAQSCATVALVKRHRLALVIWGHVFVFLSSCKAQGNAQDCPAVDKGNGGA